MTRVLDRQIEALHRDRPETPRAAVPADRRSIESAIDVGVSLFEAAKNDVRRWQQDVADWNSAETIEQARAFDTRYRVLHQTLQGLLVSAGELETADPASPPENVGRLRESLRELAGIVCFDMDRVIAADRAFREGKATRTTAEVRDELRRRVGG